MKKITLSIFMFAMTLLSFSQTELATNGDFETGDDTGYILFQNGGSAALDNTVSNGGTWSGKLETSGPSNPAFKQEFIGAGTVAAGDEVTVSFDHIGTVVQPGAVFNVLLFGEGSGGASFTQALNPAPALSANWTTYSASYTIPMGTDVSQGISFLIQAVCGGDAGCSVSANIDNVSVTVPDSGPTARVQVIHNSADAAASVVDVYLDGELALDDVAFRTASPFIDVPADTDIEVAVAPGNSASVNDAIGTFNYNLTENETYILVANGIVSPTGYSPSPAFGIDVFNMGRESASTAGNTDVLIHHGSTDAPTVDVDEVTAGNLVDDISYSEFQGYLELPTADYQLEVKDATGTTMVASYDAPLATLGLTDAAIVVVASGFLDPSQNSDGPAFGLWVALPAGGDLVELPTAGTTVGPPTTDAPESGSTGTDLYVYSGLSGSSVDNFSFNEFQGGGTVSEADIEGNGNNAGLIEGTGNTFFYGAQWGQVNLETPTDYTHVHLNYYVESGSDFSFYLIDQTAGIPGGAIEEPRFTFAESGGDASLVKGEWVSVFIPLQHFLDYDSGAFTYDLEDIWQYKFDGNGPATIYFDNIFFSTADVLNDSSFSVSDFKVFPNPANNIWRINSTKQISRVQLYDVLGKNVMTLEPNSLNVEVDGSTLNKGLYFATISTSNGSQSVKLIKN